MLTQFVDCLFVIYHALILVYASEMVKRLFQQTIVDNEASELGTSRSRARANFWALLVTGNEASRARLFEAAEAIGQQINLSRVTKPPELGISGGN